LFKPLTLSKCVVDLTTCCVQVWAWILFLLTVVVVCFMAKDVIGVLMALPKIRSGKK